MLTYARGSHCPGSNATHPCRTGFRFCRPNRRSSASERSPQRPPTTSLLVRRRSILSSTSTTKASNCPYRRGPFELFSFTQLLFPGSRAQESSNSADSVQAVNSSLAGPHAMLSVCVAVCILSPVGNPTLHAPVFNFYFLAFVFSRKPRDRQKSKAMERRQNA